MFKIKLKILAAILVVLLPVASFAENTAHWNYTAQEKWGDSPENISCKTGAKQSPINILSKSLPEQETPEITINYSDSNFKILNNGHTIQLSFAAGNTIEIEENTYNLLQLHFHTPSEHTIDTKHAPIEAHFVHKDDSGNIAVLGVMLVEGYENSEMQKVLNNAPQKHGEEIAIKNEKFRMTKLIPEKPDYYKYEGSLTTPPCSETVRWNVFKEEVEVSKNQINSFRKLYSMNARTVQPLGSREVQIIDVD